MNRDIRDPQEIGAALAAQRARSPKVSITELADEVLSHQTIRNHQESNTAFLDRIAGTTENGNQLAMFRQ
jgi:hypothetical protein